MKGSDTTSRNRRECLLWDRTQVDTATLEMLCWRRRQEKEHIHRFMEQVLQERHCFKCCISYINSYNF